MPGRRARRSCIPALRRRGCGAVHRPSIGYWDRSSDTGIRRSCHIRRHFPIRCSELTPCPSSFQRIPFPSSFQVAAPSNNSAIVRRQPYWSIETNALVILAQESRRRTARHSTNRSYPRIADTRHHAICPASHRRIRRDRRPHRNRRSGSCW